MGWTRHDEGLWSATDTLQGAIRFPLRMTVMAIEGGVALWSPVAIDDALARRIDQVGEVRFIVAPNLMHHVHARAAKRRYPGARLVGPSALHDKIGLAIDEPLEGTGCFGDALALFPIGGSPRVQEVVALHVASRSLVVTDLVFNIHRCDGWLTRFVLRYLSGAYGELAQSRLLRMATRDRDAARESLAPVVAADFDRLVVAHGDVIETGARAPFLASLAWMLGDPPPRLLTAPSRGD